jgi:hypothetical protein
MARYGSKAKQTVSSAMRRRKRGTLTSGRSGKKVKSRKQAIAIGLSEARRKAPRCPPIRTGPRARRASSLDAAAPLDQLVVARKVREQASSPPLRKGTDVDNPGRGCLAAFVSWRTEEAAS